MKFLRCLGLAFFTQLAVCGGHRVEGGGPAVLHASGSGGANQGAAVEQAAAPRAIVDARLAEVDRAVDQALMDGKLPGCVVVIGRRERVLLRRAYGFRAYAPDPEEMTLDTVFDLASLTKPLATASSIMVLADRGKLDLDAPAARYVPEFARAGKGGITLRQLLTHTSGLRADTPLADFELGRDVVMQRIYDAPGRVPPGRAFAYSDTGFLVLEEVVRRVSGQDLAAFSEQNVFQPLGMSQTRFLPGPEERARAAPTEERDGVWMRGQVHDPRAFLLGGVAGHAGLFSTAEDLTRYAQAMLGQGEIDGHRVWSWRTALEFFAPHDVPGAVRALGWDVQSGYSGNRGDGWSPRAVGHGGYTGVVLWLDPARDAFVLVLSNRVHPEGKGNVNALAARIGTIATSVLNAPDEPPDLADASGKVHSGPGAVVGLNDPSSRNTSAVHSGPGAVVGLNDPSSRNTSAVHSGPGAVVGLNDPSSRSTSAVHLGIDVLRAEHFRRLRGARVGLLTNAAGRAGDGRATAEILAGAPGVKLVALFTPEHGIGGDREGKIADGRDPQTGLPIYSLYGSNGFEPSPESLAGIDTLVVDLQDAGARFYTYPSTLRRVLETSAKYNVRVVVLDRPDPIDGVTVSGPVLSPPCRARHASAANLVNENALPVRHGMTMGELALLFNAEHHLGAPLDVVPMEGWHRAQDFDATGLTWTPPSPNLRTGAEVLLYPAVGMLEATNLSVGRGTETPFEVLGAPWIDAGALASALQGAGIAGVSFSPATFTPRQAPYAGQSCGGVQLAVTSRALFEPVKTGLAIASTLHALHPKEWHFADVDKMLCDPKVLAALEARRSMGQVESLWKSDLDAFLSRRSKYLLYR